jgi:hypothetical protein
MSSSNFEGKKQPALKPFLLNGAASSEPNQPIRQLSTQSEPVQKRRQRSSRRTRLSNRNRNGGSVSQTKKSPNVPDEAPGLVELIWKYFETEIREALLETQESLPNDNVKTYRAAN